MVRMTLKQLKRRKIFRFSIDIFIQMEIFRVWEKSFVQYRNAQKKLCKMIQLKAYF